MNCRFLPLSVAAALVATIGTASYGATVRLKKISFLDDHQMYQTAAPSGWGAGAGISDPVWTDAGTREPVTYTRGRTLKLQVEVQVTAKVPMDSRLRFFASEALYGEGQMNAPAGSSTQVVIVSSAHPLPAEVLGYLPMNLSWTFRDPDSGNAWMPATPSNTANNVYLTLSDPLTSLPTNPLNASAGNLVTEKRVAQVVDWANLAVSADQVTDLVWKGLTGKWWGYGSHADPWKIMSMTDGVADCDDQANLMRHAIGIHGVAGTVKATYPSADTPDPFSQETRNHSHGCDSVSEILLADCGGVWNNFEGFLDTAGGCYAVWPAMKKPNPCDILAQFTSGCKQQWVDSSYNIIHANVPMNCSTPNCK